MSDVESEPEFEAAESGASDTYPMQCSALRKSGFVMIKGFPCKIVDMSTSKVSFANELQLSRSHEYLASHRLESTVTPRYT